MPLFLNELLNLLLTAAVFVVSMFISTLLHELGHAGAYRLLLKDKNWKICIGLGKPLLQAKKIVINKLFFWSGCCCAEKSKSAVSKGRQILIHSAGFIVNIFIMILLYAFMRYHADEEVLYQSMALNLWLQIARFAFNLNFFLILFSVIPIKFPFKVSPGGAMHNDGYAIYNLIKNKNIETNDHIS